MYAQAGAIDPQTSSRSIDRVRDEVLACCRRLLSAAGCEARDPGLRPSALAKALAKLRRQSCWYLPFERLYASLEDHAALTAPSLCEAVLSNPAIKLRLPALYALRASYEADLEWDRARRTIEDAQAPDLIRRQVDHKLRSLPASFYEVLESKTRILMAGSGPLPTTAMALVEVFGRPVVCLDRDARANRVGAAYVRAGGYGDKIDFVTAELGAFDRLAGFDALVGAFLLGVGTELQPVSAKTQVMRSLMSRVDTGAAVVLRTPQGLGALIYPPLVFEATDPVQLQFHPQAPCRRQPYDSTFAVLRRLD